MFVLDHIERVRAANRAAFLFSKKMLQTDKKKTNKTNKRDMEFFLGYWSNFLFLLPFLSSPPPLEWKIITNQNESYVMWMTLEYDNNRYSMGFLKKTHVFTSR